MHKHIFAIAAAASAVAATPALADAFGDGVTVTTGIDYSSGNYGTDSDTDLLIVPLSVRYKAGDLRFTATMPWLRIDGSSAVVGDGSGGVVIDPNAPRSVRSGFGDLSLGVAYAIPEDRLGFGLDLSARVKLPTADEGKRLGTGKTDVTVGAEISRTIGIFTPFASVSYRMPGSPDGINLHNAWSTSIGGSMALGPAMFVASYDYRQATSDLVDDSHEIFGAISTPVADRLDLTLYGSAGLSDGAPDYGVGTMLSLKF